MSWSQWTHEKEEDALWGHRGEDPGLGRACGPREQEGAPRRTPRAWGPQSKAGEDPLPSLGGPQSEAGGPPQSLGAPQSEAGEETLGDDFTWRGPAGPG